MKENKYKVLLAFTLISLAFCLFLPINASLNYVRQMSDEYAWYIAIDEASTTYNDDAGIVVFITIPSLVVIYIAFLHYLLIPLYKPENHHDNILPIFYYEHRFLGFIGRVLSYSCVFTMPVLIPIGIFYVYNTKMTSELPYIHYNDTESFFVYLLPMMLMLGAGLFFFFYILYFSKKTIMFIRKKRGLSGKDMEEWFIY